MDKKKVENIKINVKKTVLVAPLDWGLGHATRCIPIIYGLVKEGHKVLVAAEGPIKILLEQEFQDIEYLPLKGYRINYNKTQSSFSRKIMLQAPKILKAISFERRWLNEIIKKYKIDIVISDNRFGLHNKKVFSVFITHQLLIKSPYLQEWIQKFNYHLINKFDECWVPDFSSIPGLAGELSHPKKMPATPARYIGWLSRFKKSQEKKQEKHLLILLSGPEPQRTILEKKILAQLEKYFQPVFIVRGLPGNKSALKTKSNVDYINHLPSKELEEVILHATFVIARSGYSSVMDLLKLKKKAIFIPTPGQTEQEYLSKHLLQQQLAYCTNQETFNLETALQSAGSFPYAFFHQDANPLLMEALSFNNYNKKNLQNS